MGPGLLRRRVFAKGTVTGGPGRGGRSGGRDPQRSRTGEALGPRPGQRGRTAKGRPGRSSGARSRPLGLVPRCQAGPRPLPAGCESHLRSPPASAALRRRSPRDAAPRNTEEPRGAGHLLPCPSPLPLPAAQSEQTRRRLPVQHLRNTFYLHGISSGHCTLYTDIFPLQQGRSCARLVASSGVYPTVHGKCPPHLEVSAVRVQVTFPVLLSLLR